MTGAGTVEVKVDDAQGLQPPYVWIKVVGKGVHKTDSLKDCTSAEILTEHHRYLVQPGCSPYLCIPEAELMLTYTTSSFENDLRGDVQHGPHACKVVYLANCFRDRELGYLASSDC